MKFRNYRYLLLLLIVGSFSSSAFDYELNFRNFDSPLLKRIGCNCENQDEFDWFLGNYYTNVARKLQMELGVDAGILKKNTWAAKGFMNTYNNVLLGNWIDSEPQRIYDGFVIYVDWPEFGE